MLDGVGVADLFARRITAGLAGGAAPAQQVPQLIQGHLQLLQLGLLGIVESAALGVVAQLVLARDQGLDPRLNALVRIFVGHATSLTQPSTRHPLASAAVSTEEVAMNVGIIGAGNIGRATATRLVAAGHHVMLSNSRGPETLAALEQELGEAATVGTPADAARFGEVVIVATPLAALGALPAAELAGKVVVDANNYYPGRDGQIETLDSGELGSSELFASHVPGARVVKAFNTMWSENLLHKALPPGASGRVALPVASDDDQAKERVGGLIDDMGFDWVDAGTLRDGRRQEPETPVYNKLLDVEGVREALRHEPEA